MVFGGPVTSTEAGNITSEIDNFTYSFKLGKNESKNVDLEVDKIYFFDVTASGLDNQDTVIYVNDEIFASGQGSVFAYITILETTKSLSSVYRMTIG